MIEPKKKRKLGRQLARAFRMIPYFGGCNMKIAKIFRFIESIDFQISSLLQNMHQSIESV